MNLYNYKVREIPKDFPSSNESNFIQIIRQIKGTIKTWNNSSTLNLAVFPNRNMRPQAGAIRIGTDNDDEMPCCLKKHRNADARDAIPFERSLHLLLFSHFSMSNLHTHKSKQTNCIALETILDAEKFNVCTFNFGIWRLSFNFKKM